MASPKGDSSVLARINQLVSEEERLYGQNKLTGEDENRLAELKAELHQCWDLLRQRRVLQEFAKDPEEAKVRPARTVENYQQ